MPPQRLWRGHLLLKATVGGVSSVPLQTVQTRQLWANCRLASWTPPEVLLQPQAWLYRCFVPGRGYCASVERGAGAGSGDFESVEQELLSKFDKYRNSTRNRNLDGNFLPNILFLVKIGAYYRGCRRPFNPLQWKKLSNFFWSRELYNIQ
jgi:hypothetical protein